MLQPIRNGPTAEHTAPMAILNIFGCTINDLSHGVELPLAFVWNSRAQAVDEGTRKTKYTLTATGFRKGHSSKLKTTCTRASSQGGCAVFLGNVSFKGPYWKGHKQLLRAKKPHGQPEPWGV